MQKTGIGTLGPPLAGVLTFDINSTSRIEGGRGDVYIYMDQITDFVRDDLKVYNE